MTEPKIEDFGNQTERDKKAFETVNQKDLLQFAQNILIGVLGFSVFASLLYCCLVVHGKAEAATLFETLLLTVIPSFVTLVIGFYFGKKLQ